MFACCVLEPYKVEGGLMVQFFGLVFSVAPSPPGKISVDALGYDLTFESL